MGFNFTRITYPARCDLKGRAVAGSKGPRPICLMLPRQLDCPGMIPNDNPVILEELLLTTGARTGLRAILCILFGTLYPCIKLVRVNSFAKSIDAGPL